MRRPPPALRKFLEPYGPQVTRLFFATRAAILGRSDHIHELIYDAYNAVAAGYSFTERPSDAFCHVAAYAGWVNLGFNFGATLPDPEKLLVGKGNRIRHIRITDPAQLDAPAVQALIAAATAAATRGETTRAKSVVRAIYARRRRPGA